MLRKFSLVFFLLIGLLSLPVRADTLLILGDSLSAGYQMPLDKAWPSLLAADLKKAGKSMTVVNASVSGDTSGNALGNLPKLLTQFKPSVVLIEIGANDGLRGFSPRLIEKNLLKILKLIKNHGAEALIMQINILPNYGKKYTEMFSQIYPSVAKQTQTPLIEFFLPWIIANKPEWMMPDGLHPNAQAQAWISAHVSKQIVNYL